MKKSLYIVIFVWILGMFVSFNAGRVLAVDPFPEPRVPCVDDDPSTWEDPEYHSLRPYQASPCGDSVKAIFCGNELKITESLHRSRGANFSESMQVDVRVNKTYIIELSDVQLPIFGNTEKVLNSQNNNEEFDDAQKMNEYLSWYLSGTNQKAEYGPDTVSKVIDFSGPVKKLLPSAIQEFRRFEVLHDAGTKDEFTQTEGELEDSVDINSAEEGIQVNEGKNHNQIVVCTSNDLEVSIFGVDITIPWIGEEKPIPCYEGDGSEAQGEKYRLIDWWESKEVGFLAARELLPDWNPYSVWGHATPPFPWQFTKDVYYQKAYREWRGQNCILVPISEKLLCGDIRIPGTRFDIKTNKWADLYQYIPLADTVDKNAKVPITNTGNPHPEGDTEIEFELGSTEYLEQAVLFFPHTIENKMNSDLLNSSFLPYHAPNSTIDYTTTEQERDETGNCRVVNVRTNDGDNLFAEHHPDEYRIKVDYTFTEIPCSEPEYNENLGIYRQSCDGSASVTLNTVTKTPYAKDIFENTVAGESSAFRKIFPKVEEGAPVSCIANIPAVSNATYTFTDDGGGPTQTKLRVVGPDGQGGDGSDAKLYFPYVGSVYEYFLKGIQTALRPQGYGTPITDGTLCVPATQECGEWESKLGGSGGACGICNAPIGELAKKILTAAGTAYNVPAANIWAAMKHEGADGYQGTTYDFSDENVRKWSNSVACGGEPMPGCDNTNPVTQPPFGFLSHWFYLGEGNNALWSAVQVIDPTRNTKESVSRCNFLDAAFAAAKLLNQGASNTTVGLSCGSYSGFDTTSPGTCSSAFWTDTKVAQSQTGYAGSCVNTSGGLYTLEQAVGWYHEASCQ